MRNILRFSVGLVRLPILRIQSNLKTDFKVVSFDVFGTLVQRISDEHYALVESARKTYEVALKNGLSPQGDPVKFRREVEADIIFELLRNSENLEFKNEIIIRRMLQRMGGECSVLDEAANVADWELEQEIQCTMAQTKVSNLVKQWADRGIRIIAISDTRYTQNELARLLSSHGLIGLSAIYTSVDHGNSKYGGHLYDRVLAEEKVQSSQLLHFGDNIISDIFSASERGIPTRWVRRTKPLPELPEPPKTDETDQFVRFGYDTLGPVFVGFLRLIFEYAKEKGVTTLLFVARDGILPLKVAEIFYKALEEKPVLLKYLYLSRRAVAPSSIDFIAISDDQRAIDSLVTETMCLSGDKNLIFRLRSYFDIDPDLVVREMHRLGLSSGNEEELRAFLRDKTVANALNADCEPKRRRLFKYLLQEGVFRSDHALVDIGWRGTIHKTIGKIANSYNLPSPLSFYFGFWTNSSKYEDPKDLFGLIADQRRGRNLLEGSSWYNVFLFESVCRADHGMLNGFSEDELGAVRPSLIEVGGARSAELGAEAAKKKIQSGVLNYADWYARNSNRLRPNVIALRKEVQYRLFRLAFFPTNIERMVGKNLFHSDPSDDNWASALICSRGRGFKGWALGIRSPWKGGYFREYGGLFLAIIYCIAESVLVNFTIESKLSIRSWLANFQKQK